MIGIYKITNPEGKVYIGKSRNIKSRFTHYKQGYSNSKLSKSFKDFGIDNHIFEVIEECDLHDLNIKEHFYINMYDSINKGFNVYNASPNIKVKDSKNTDGYSYISINIKSEEERELLKQNAEEAGRTLSDYCRRKLLGLL